MIIIDGSGLFKLNDKKRLFNAKIKVGAKFSVEELKKALEGETEMTIVDGLFPEPEKPFAEKLCDIAEAEAFKQIQWTSETCEAEKYLKPLRQAVGQSKGRFSWCAAFVHWCCEQAGRVIPDNFPTGYTAAYVPAWETWAKANKQWFSSRLKASEFNPQAGDIVVFDWNADAVPDHIGIVLSYDGNRTLTTAEGNTSSANQTDGNSTAVRKRDWNVCRGFIRLS